MLISIDAKIAFDVIQYQILTKAIKQRFAETQKKTKYPSSTLRKERKLDKGHLSKINPNSEEYSIKVIKRRELLCDSQLPRSPSPSWYLDFCISPPAECGWDLLITIRTWQNWWTISPVIILHYIAKGDRRSCLGYVMLHKTPSCQKIHSPLSLLLALRKQGTTL